MISEIEQLMDERPKVRRVFDEIDDFFDKMLVVNYIICITFSAVVICVPTIMAFFYLPENVCIWISSIIGGILSLIVIPLLINHIKCKQNKADELYEINKPLYQDLSAIFVQLLQMNTLFMVKM